MDDDAELERIRVVRAVQTRAVCMRGVDWWMGKRLFVTRIVRPDMDSAKDATSRQHVIAMVWEWGGVACNCCDCDVTRRDDTQEYTAGRMLTGELKGILVKVLQDMVAAHQKARAAVTNEMVEAFMAMRRMRF
jgi:tryptophanyl-tRNA synthetase